MAKTKEQTLSQTDPQTDELIARYIRRNPSRPEPDQAQVVVGNAGVPVWVIVSYLRGPEGIEQAATAFELPTSAVAAAVAYYERHRGAIDARLLLQDTAFAD